MTGEPADPKSEAVVDETPAVPAEPSTPEGRIAALEEALREKSEEAAAHYDRFLRQAAELENFKRRSQREQAEGLRRANERLLSDVLPVLDNFERAVAHAEEQSPLVAGLQMVMKLFDDALSRNNVEVVSPAKGDRFDPNVHEAIGAEPADQAPNTVVRVELKGYRLNDRLLRAAQVIVAAAPAADGPDGA